jgi:putative transposase
MENHIHWIASGENLNEQIRNFKSFTARAILDGLEREGFATVLKELHYFKIQNKAGQIFQLWQEGSHPQEILNKDMMRQKLEYIHQNPVRRGYVDKPEDWRYSSARNYAGHAGLMSVTMQW